MPTNVRIDIVGMCLCFRKEYPPESSEDPVWNVIFPCDSRHRLSLTFPQPDAKDDGTQRPAGTTDLHTNFGRDLDIEVHRTDSVTTPCTYDSTFGNLLNLAETRLHGVKGNGKHSKLKLDQRKEDCDQAWMRVPHSVLSAAPPASPGKNSWLWEVNPAGNIVGLPSCRSPKSEAISLTLQAEDAIQLTVIEDTGDVVFDEKFSGENVVLAFNNKCPVNDGHNDFLNIYESVLDEEKNAKRYVHAKAALPCVFPFKSEDIKTEVPKEREANPYADIDPEILRDIGINLLKALEKIIMTPQANCDPVGSEPPPGP